MKIKASSPCRKFRDATPEEQIAKLFEELSEIEEALNDYRQHKVDSLELLLMEIIDLKACCNTFIYQLVGEHRPYRQGILKAAKEKVIVKNMARGYYFTPEQIDALNTNE